MKRFAGMEPGRPVGGTYYLYRTLRNLDLDGMLEKLMESCSKQQVGGELTPRAARRERDEYNDRIEQFKREIEAEIRRRLVADRGVEAMARTLRKPLPEDVDFMHASREEMQNLKKAIYPLTRKLAARLARKRRHGRKGPLDFRNTVRHSLSYGGVPAEPKFKYPRPAKPELMVVADISGSVAAFARFTLMLVYAIQGQFSKVRSFVFIDGIDEVTRFFEGVEDITEAVHRVNTEADVVWVDGHSDYGHAFEVFWQRYGTSISLEDHGAAARRRAQQLPRLPGLEWSRRCAPRPAPRLLAEPGAEAATGTPVTRSSAITARTPTASTSAATCASSKPSSTSSRNRRVATIPVMPGYCARGARLVSPPMKSAAGHSAGEHGLPRFRPRRRAPRARSPRSARYASVTGAPKREGRWWDDQAVDPRRMGRHDADAAHVAARRAGRAAATRPTRTISSPVRRHRRRRAARRSRPGCSSAHVEPAAGSSSSP